MNKWEDDYQLYQDLPIIVSPNIGIPQFIPLKNLDSSSWKKLPLIINIVGLESNTDEEIYSCLKNNLFLVPLYDLHPKYRKLTRGSSIPIEIQKISSNISLGIHNTDLHSLYNLEPEKKSFLIHYDFFGKNRRIFNVKVLIDLSNQNEIKNRFFSHPFVMFDLVQKFSSLDDNVCRIAYHSVVIHKDDWKNLNLAHITDLHIAKRFDELLTMVKKKNRKLDELKQLFQVQIPNLEDRYKNPNNYLRRFIKWANFQKNVHELDLIIASGDLIDYYLKNNYKRQEEYGLKESNWEVFLKIILNDPINLRFKHKALKIEEGEELSVPIITCTGNHDVRVFGYPITSLNIFKKFGLTQIEALLYEDPFERKKIRAISTDRYCLRPYYQFINPFDDFFYKLGENLFIFLNSGGDSLSSIKGMLMGDPNSLGFSDRQISFLSNVIGLYNNQKIPLNNYFLVSHTPILNPFTRKFWKRALGKIFRKQPFFDRERYKAHHLRKITKGDGRGNGFLNFDHGVISRNWLTTLILMYKHQMINICGHTHRAQEIMYILDLKEAEYSKKNFQDIENTPFAFYWDDFTSLSEYSIDFIRKRKPFVMQTPSLGIGRDWDDNRRGALRIYNIIDNKIANIKVKYLSDETPW